ncbi:non-specific lipid-transfer protein 1-like [Miscanthus floridulus]|uniref:non-specific lipid-transfer protein 1-like n=1 Tax=Miscanthus floridulus TaxID=154761 RepID=UPI00345AAF60
MKTSSSGIAVLLVAMLAVEAAVQVRADISCPDVLNDLSPCLPFLQGNAPLPSDQCCGGVRALYAAADTRPARQATCRCLKAAYLQVHAQLPAAQALPGDCGVPISYEITPDIDCDKIE